MNFRGLLILLMVGGLLPGVPYHVLYHKGLLESSNLVNNKMPCVTLRATTDHGAKACGSSCGAGIGGSSIWGRGMLIPLAKMKESFNL